MKKLLTILALALALCLLCSAAMADEIELGGKAYQDAYQAVKAAGFRESFKIDYTVGGSTATVTFTLNPVNAKDSFKCEQVGELEYNAPNPFDASKTLVFHVQYTNGHNGPLTLLSKTAAKCTTPSTETYLCMACLKQVVTHDDPALGHSWERTTPTYKHVITTAPTCQTSGVYEHACTDCGAIEPDYKQVIAPVAHDFITIATKIPNCKDDGTYYYGCRFCRKSWEEIHNAGMTYFWQDGYAAWSEKPADADPMGHDWDGWIVKTKPTCDKYGTRVRVCKICAEEDVETDWSAEPLLPVYAETDRQVIDCYHVVLTFKCVNCGSKSALHPAITVDCKNGSVATVSSVTVKDYWLNTYDNWELIGLSPVDPMVVAAHEYVIKDKYKITVKPECETKGYTAYKCIHDTNTYTYNAATNTITPAADHPFKKVDEVPAAGHDWEKKEDGGWVLKYKPGDGENEYYVYYRTCGICGKTENKTSATITPEQCEGHKWIVDETNSFAPTCTEAGKTAYVCEYCLLSKGPAEEVPALGHDWDETVKKAATCKEEGLVNRICKRCNLAEANIKVDKLAHTWDEGKITKEAT
ncbi:MAG: hypothetical protein Q4G00_14950, partial [Clostridia bacterium]|nr:hypothetical protein [Clostridia bacterium]